MRKMYRPLVPPRPLPPNSIRFPDIDMKVLNGKQFPAIEEIVNTASERANASLEGTMPADIEDLEQALVEGFSMPRPSSASTTLRIWTLSGWAVATLEEERGVAKKGKAERHYYAALNLRRGQLIEDAPEGIGVYADAFELGIYSAYYLRRSPVTSASDLRESW